VKQKIVGMREVHPIIIKIERSSLKKIEIQTPVRENIFKKEDIPENEESKEKDIHPSVLSLKIQAK
jgi:hypothetical protein